jgi:hypothetical protein
MMVGLISGRGNIGVISPHVVTLAWAAVTQQQFNNFLVYCVIYYFKETPKRGRFDVIGGSNKDQDVAFVA